VLPFAVVGEEAGCVGCRKKARLGRIVRPIKLRPLQRKAPRCESFDEEEAIRRFEREMRQHRAYTEPYLIQQLGEGVEAFRVRSTSGTPGYTVDIVDGSQRRDTCTCQDFFTNDLGTCKHIEAVRRLLAASRALREEYAAMGSAPRRPTLVVQAEGGLRLVTAGRWSRRAMQAAGLVEVDGRIEPAQEGPLAQASADTVRITAAAPVAWERIRAERQLVRRGEQVKKALQKGKLGIDILNKPLFPYQREGVAHLLREGRALLSDDMGLGKTVQAIGACEVLCARGEAERVLIVAPASLKDQWAKEIHRYAGHRAVVVGGSQERRRAALRSDARYKIVNYELTWRNLEDLQALNADILVLDEAQRAKNFRTRTSTTLRSIPSRFLFVLTGTPIENRLDDLYALMQLVDPGLLAPLWRFNLRFHQQTSTGKIVGYKNLGALRAVVAPKVLRRRKEEVLPQLPPVTHQTRYTKLTPEQERQEADHRQTAARLAAMAEHRALSPEERERLLAALLKARQACNAAELCDPKTPHPGSPKLDEFEQLVDEIASQGTQKILVFSEWVTMLRLAAERLDRIGVGYRMLHGSIPTERRPALLQDFHDKPEAQVLLSSDAGGVGLNLQVATYIIHLDLPWNPARLDQRIGRAHRLGQTRGVTVTYLCAEAGIERGIEGTLGLKRSVRSAALDVNSDIESLTAPNFAAFLRSLRDLLADIEGDELEEEAESLLPESFPESGADSLVPSQEPLSEATGPLALPAPTEAPADALENPSGGAPANVPEATADGAPEATADGAPTGVQKAPAGEAPTDVLEATAPITSGDAPASSAQATPGADADGIPDGSTKTPQKNSTPGEARLVPEDPAAAQPPGEPRAARPPVARRSRSHEKLRLAKLVLEAGFAGDSVRAAYEALASAIGGLLEGTTAAPTLAAHTTLLAAIFRDLLPAGRLPQGAHGALARLHDLATLESLGIEVDPALAQGAVNEAELWVDRLTTA
jgi:superfamily II DNA or RNA helicase